MSTWVEREIGCACGRARSVRIARGLYGPRLPEVRAAILRGELHRFECEDCRRVTLVEARLVYTDFPNGHYVAVELPTKDRAVALREHRGVFARGFDDGPPLAQALGRSLRKRLVFGRDALREKLAIWDAGLDDRVVEAVKADLSCGSSCGRFQGVFRDVLVFDGMDVPRERYDARAADPAGIARDHPQLTDEWCVA